MTQAGSRVDAGVGPVPGTGAWPAWFSLVPSWQPEVLVVADAVPERCPARHVTSLAQVPSGQYGGIVLADATAQDVAMARALLRPGGWLCAGLPRAVARRTGMVPVERYVPLPDHRTVLVTLPVTRGATRLLARTFLLPYAPPGRARRLRRAAMLAARPVLALFPATLLARVAPSQVLLLRDLG